MLINKNPYIIIALFTGIILGIAGCFIPFLTIVTVFISLLTTAIILCTYVIGNKYLFRRVLHGAPFVKSSDEAIKTMLEFSKVCENKKVLDLGSGDGRIVKTFAERGVEVIGYEIDPVLVLFSKLKTRNLSNVCIKWANFWTADFSKYEVIIIFGIGYIMGKLERRLLNEVKPGTVVITSLFPLPNVKYVDERNGVYLYRL
jgi:SAM-dependent methyltransferase